MLRLFDVTHGKLAVLQRRSGNYNESRRSVHCDVDILHSQLAMNFFHSCTCILHSHQGFLINICGFDRVDLLLEHGDLTIGLLKRVLVLLLALESVACRYGFSNQHKSLCKDMKSQSLPKVRHRLECSHFMFPTATVCRYNVPVLFVNAFSFAISCCFAI